MNKNICIKKIIKNIEDLNKNNLESHNIYYKTYDDDIYTMKLLFIGTKNTPYENGFYLFDLKLPEDYPFSPPKMKYCTNNNKTRFNPNLYINGKVCLSLLNTWSGPKWTSCNSLTSLLLSLQAIVFIENPLHNEPGFENDISTRCINYNKILYYQNINTAIINTIKNLPNSFSCFEGIIIQKFLENYNLILEFINKQTLNEVIIDANIYNMKEIINYKILKKELIKLYENILEKNNL